MKEETLYEIAKIVSNEFCGSLIDESFCFEEKEQWFFLKTNKCDYAPFIRVFKNETKVMVLGDYTDGWQDVHPETLSKIKDFLAKRTP